MLAPVLRNAIRPAPAMSPPAGEDPETEQERFDPKSSPLSLVLYGKTGWRPLLPCRNEVTDATSPALSTIDDDVLLFCGGIIPQADTAAVHEMGFDGVFGPGTNTNEIIDFVREHARMPTA